MPNNDMMYTSATMNLLDIRPHTTLLPTRPILKWAGGKSQLLPILHHLIPAQYNRYAEPFLGGGALFFSLAPPESLVADSNPELMNFYRVVRDRPQELIVAVTQMSVTKDEYYKTRSLIPENLDDIQRASRFIYLNKTCYNGLYRVNRKGQFNTPFGGKNEVNLIDTNKVLAASQILNHADIRCGDFAESLSELTEGDFVYLDPPYIPVSKYSNFKRYTRNFFGEKEHLRLAIIFRQLSDRGVMVLLSNSDNPIVRSLYADFHCISVLANRQINCRAEKRGQITELIIANYPLAVPDIIS